MALAGHAFVVLPPDQSPPDEIDYHTSFLTFLHYLIHIHQGLSLRHLELDQLQLSNFNPPPPSLMWVACSVVHTRAEVNAPSCIPTLCPAFNKPHPHFISLDHSIGHVPLPTRLPAVPEHRDSTTLDVNSHPPDRTADRVPPT